MKLIFENRHSRTIKSDLTPLICATPAADTMAPVDAQGLLDYALTLIEGGELMFTMEVPYVPAQEAPIVLVQADTAAAPPAPDSILNE